MRRAKSLILTLLPLLVLSQSLRAEGKAVILDYHSFLGTGTSNLDYSEAELAAQLDEIAGMGYRFVSLDDAIAGRLEGEANVVITIDDGNHTILPAFTRVFEPRGIKPFLFVYPAIVLGRLRYALTPEQLKYLADAGCGVGAHGYHHDAVTDKAWERDPKDFMDEIERPGPALARILGARPALYGYPFGVYSRRAEEAVAAAGYAWAFAGDDQVRQVSFDDPGLDRMAVPRTITYRYNRGNLMRALRKLLDYDGPSPKKAPLFESPSPESLSAGGLPADVAR
jgi:peptidoglycan/xylan/chitin deacetylase (PgdA/CDA1 family)